MAETETQRLAREYANYDRSVEIVSSAEVWFTRQKEMAKTVLHFERYPVIPHPDGNEATPDFTVLFTDNTAIVGEVSNVALRAGSFDGLWHQIKRYSELTQIPAGGDKFEAVTEVDVVAFIPDRAAQRTCDLIAEKRASEDDPLYVSVLASSHEADTGAYTFMRIERANNPRPRGHGRKPSLESWLSDPTNADTLRGKPGNFGPIKTQRRFVNDPMSTLYLSVVLWSQLFAELAGGEKDIKATVEEIADELKKKFGRGKVAEVRAALNLLKRAKLAVETADYWVIDFREIGTAREPVQDVLLHRLESPPRGPITHEARDRRRKNRKEKENNIRKQEELDLGS